MDPATGDVVGRPDSQLGSTIVGITFLVMGPPPLLLGAWSGIKGLGSRDERQSAPTAGAGAAGGIMGRMRAGLDQAQAAQGIGARMQWGTGGRGGAGKSSGDALGKLERLQKLRESGAINDSEFEREKAKILAE